MTKQKKAQSPQEHMPSAEEVQAELAKVQSMDDFFGKEGVFARLFASTLEQMLEGELTEHLGYEPYEATGRNSGNNRNGHYAKKVRTSTGQTSIQVARDRNGEFECLHTIQDRPLSQSALRLRPHLVQHHRAPLIVPIAAQTSFEYFSVRVHCYAGSARRGSVLEALAPYTASYSRSEDWKQNLSL